MRLRNRIAELADHCAASSQASATISLKRSFPSAHNSSALVRAAVLILSALLGAEAVLEIPPIMGPEDVSWIADCVEAPLLRQS